MASPIKSEHSQLLTPVGSSVMLLIVVFQKTAPIPIGNQNFFLKKWKKKTCRNVIIPEVSFSLASGMSKKIHENTLEPSVSKPASIKLILYHSFVISVEKCY